MKETNHEKEKCVVCHKTLDIDKSMPIDKRKYYIKGAGQLCERCYKELYEIKDEDY